MASLTSEYTSSSLLKRRNLFNQQKLRSTIHLLGSRSKVWAVLLITSTLRGHSIMQESNPRMVKTSWIKTKRGKD